MHWIDPDSLRPVRSKVLRFLFNPEGEADGMLLSNGTEAHFPPHLSRKVLKHIRPGQAVTVYGIKPRLADMLSCIAIESAHSKRIDDTGPPRKAKKKGHPGRSRRPDNAKQIRTEGHIERPLHGPKGEIRGVLLSDGAIVRFSPHAAHGASNLLKVGAFLCVQGELGGPAGTPVITAKKWGKTSSRLLALPKKHGH